MNDVCGSMIKEPWYKKSRFPLVPVIRIKKGDQWNSRGFMFSWLGLSVGDAMSPQFDFHLHFSAHSLIGFRLGLPYLNIWFSLLPLPYFFSSTIQNWTWRVGERSKFKWMR